MKSDIDKSGKIEGSRELTARLQRSTTTFGKFLVTDAIILLHKLGMFSLEFPHEHLKISDIDLELDKYSVPMMIGIFKGSNICDGLI